MKNHILLLALLLISMSSCNRNAVLSPLQYQPTKKAVQYTPFGSWVNIEYTVDGTGKIYGGELITVDTNQIILLDLQSNIHEIPIRNIINAKILLHQSDAIRYGKLTAIGAYASIPVTGFFAVFVTPAWIITGVRASIKARGQGYFLDPIYYPWEEIAHFARFPKGLPEAVDLSKLKAKEFGVNYKVK